MHPAASLIAFTTLSGLGFGLMAWAGAGLGPAGLPGAALALLALATASAGLLASLLHLGNPQRAWRALSQWRSSWLSREGVLALATLSAFAASAGLAAAGRPAPALGAAAALLALLTVTATAMIYAQLRTVPAWNGWTTPALFLAHALGGPAILLAPLPLAAAGPALAGAALLLHWRRTGVDTLAARGSGTATAIGLPPGTRVRPFEPPHTGRNYLLDEMVFRVARRRAAALRRLALGLGAVLPAVLLLAATAGAEPLLRGAALLLHLAGTAAGRWLFFAEAEHAVGLYYPRQSAIRPE